MWVNDLIRKLRLISKFITSGPGKQTIAIYILPNISRNKGEKTLKFGQSTEYNHTELHMFFRFHYIPNNSHPFLASSYQPSTVRCIKAQPLNITLSPSKYSHCFITSNTILWFRLISVS